MFLSKTTKITVVCLLALGMAATGQSTLQVPSATHPTIQSALIAASNGDIIHVAAGTYVENINFMGKTVALLGAGIGSSIIDGGQGGSVVTFAGGEGPTTILDGFTITNGTGTVINSLIGPISMGGGVFGDALINGSQNVTSPWIRHCEITGNSADWGAGLYYFRSVSGIVEDCTFSFNTAAQGPGGLGTFQAPAMIIRRCVFNNNIAGSAGGLSIDGQSNLNSSTWPVIEDCIFESNVCVGITSTISSPISGAGALSLGQAGAHVRRCTFRGNFANRGGAIGTINSPGFFVEDCLFDGNMADDGGAFHLTQGGFSGIHTFRFCTFVNNQATNQGTVLHTTGATTTVVQNCIMQGNGGGAPMPQLSAASSVRASCRGSSAGS